MSYDEENEFEKHGFRISDDADDHLDMNEEGIPEGMEDFGLDEEESEDQYN